MRKLLFLFQMFLFQMFLLQSIALTAQVGIGTDHPDPSAVLDLKGNGKQGLLLPQVDDYHSIDNPKPGLIVYDKHEKAIVLYDGNNWIEVNSSKTVVADIRNVYLQPKWQNDIFKSFANLTMEALVRAESFDGKEANINSLMGNEKSFMIRFGDSNFKNQIQVYGGGQKFPDPDQGKGLPLDKWIHIAVTYNGNTSEITIYVNGKVQSTAHKNFGNNINLKDKDGKGFLIGKEYNNNRPFIGEILECRVWNVVRTQEQIANHRYSVEPNAKGLVGYWKFDDGVGNIVKDYSAYHNDLEVKGNTPSGKIEWKYISPP